MSDRPKRWRGYVVDGVRRSLHRLAHRLSKDRTPDLPNPVPDPVTKTWPHPCEGIKLFIGPLDRNDQSVHSLLAICEDLMRCMELIECHCHTESQAAFAQLIHNLNGLLEQVTDNFATLPYSATTLSGRIRLVGGIKREMVTFDNRERIVDENLGTWSKIDTAHVLRHVRAFTTLLGQFTITESPKLWRMEVAGQRGMSIDDLPHLPAALYSSPESQWAGRTSCAPDTRVQTLQQLYVWVHGRRDVGVLWLTGSVELGKSTIAYSMCEYLDKVGLLAASFFCSRRVLGCRDVSRLGPSVAYQLAQYSRPFCVALAGVLDRDLQALQKPIDVQTHFFVTAPLSEVGYTLPNQTVIVIDGVDALDNEEQVMRVLAPLLQVLTVSPVRLLITSQVDRIGTRMMQLPVETRHITKICLDMLDPATVRSDVECLLKAQLTQVGYDDVQTSRLVELAGQSLSNATNLLREVKFFRFAEPIGERGLVIPEGVSTVNSLMYGPVLDYVCATVGLETADVDDTREILGMLACLQEQITIECFMDLVKRKCTEATMTACSPFISTGSYNESGRRLVNGWPELAQYMHDAKRSKKHNIDLLENHALLAEACFGAMSQLQGPLKVTRSQSSYVIDRDVAGHKRMAQQEITGTALYACQHWPHHLCCSRPNDRLTRMLHEWLSTGLLVWIEILNITGNLRAVCQKLGELQPWLQTASLEGSLMILMQDAINFATSYMASPASRSTVHLYMSWLELWPTDKPVHHLYRKWQDSPVQAMANFPRGSLQGEDGMLHDDRSSLGRGLFNARVKAMKSHEGYDVYTYPGSDLVVSGVDNDRMSIWSFCTGRNIGWLLRGHTGWVTSVVYSPDGANIASSSYDDTVYIWNIHAKQPEEQSFRSHTSTVSSVAYSPDGTYIASGSWDHTIHIWDAHTGKQVGQPLRGHTGRVNSVAYSPDGAYIASGSDDNTVCIWDAHTGQLVGEPLRGHTGWVSSAAYSPDGAYIVSGSADTTVRIWDAYTGQLVGKPLIGHTDCVRSVTYSPDGAYITSGSTDMTVSIWDAHTGQQAGQPLRGHTGRVNSVAYSPDGAYIISGSWDHTIHICDAHTGQQVGQPLRGHTGSVHSVAYSPDGAYIASGSYDKTVCIWDAQKLIDQGFSTHPLPKPSLRKSPDGQCLVSNIDGSTLHIWGSATSLLLHITLHTHKNQTMSIKYSSCGTCFTSGSADSTLCVWNASTGHLVGQPLRGHTGGVNSVTYSPDGAYIASGSSDMTVRIWDAHTRQGVGRPLKGHTGKIHSVAYSPDGAYIATGSTDTTVGIWDTQSCQQVGQPLRGHTGRVNLVAYSPDGAYIISGSWDHTIHIWDAHTGKQVGQPLRGHTGRVNSVAYSPDGAYIASGSDDNTVCIWDAHTGQLVGEPLRGHTGWVNSVTYSSDGAYIVSGSLDKTVCIWSAHNGRLVRQPLRGHRAGVNTVTCSSDSTYIASSSSDGIVCLWNMISAISCFPVPSLCVLNQGLSDTELTWRQDGWIHNSSDCMLMHLSRDLLKGQHPCSITCQDMQLDFSRTMLGTDWFTYKFLNPPSKPCQL